VFQGRRVISWRCSTGGYRVGDGICTKERHQQRHTQEVLCAVADVVKVMLKSEAQVEMWGSRLDDGMSRGRERPGVPVSRQIAATVGLQTHRHSRVLQRVAANNTL
jgi:hypothetical protein